MILPMTDPKTVHMALQMTDHALVSIFCPDRKGLVDGGYTIRISVYIPASAADACLATVQNTAEGLQLSYRAGVV